MPSPRARQSGTNHLVPELPEVETERGRLAERIEGRRIAGGPHRRRPPHPPRRSHLDRRAPHRPAGRGGRAARKVHRRAARRRSGAARPPAHDRRVPVHAGEPRARRARTRRRGRGSPTATCAGSGRGSCSSSTTPPRTWRRGSARSRSAAGSRPPSSPIGSPTARRPSRRPFSTSARPRASGTSTPTRRSGTRGSTRCVRPGRSPPTRSPGCAKGSARRSGSAFGARAPISATAPTPAGGCRTSSGRTAVPGSPATAAERRWRRPGRAAAAPGTAPAARSDRRESLDRGMARRLRKSLERGTIAPGLPRESCSSGRGRDDLDGRQGCRQHQGSATRGRG